MAVIGRIEEIHRYPVKSMLGESLQRVGLGELGIPGDRAWAVRDEVRGGIRGGKKIPALMGCRARFPEEGAEIRPGETAPAAEIEIPSGERFLSSAPEAAQKLSAALDHEVTLWPQLPADALDHYRRGAPDHTDFEQELRAIFGRAPDEPLPDLGRFPPEILEFESPPGTYFDAFPLLVMSRKSLESMSMAAPDSVIDARRFRPNLVLEVDDSSEDYPELGWIGRTLQMGSAQVEVKMECPRCVMTTHGFADVPKDPGVMRSLVRAAGGNLGVYASVAGAGSLAVGDPVSLAD